MCTMRMKWKEADFSLELTLADLGICQGVNLGISLEEIGMILKARGSHSDTIPFCLCFAVSTWNLGCQSGPRKWNSVFLLVFS